MNSIVSVDKNYMNNQSGNIVKVAMLEETKSLYKNMGVKGLFIPGRAMRRYVEAETGKDISDKQGVIEGLRNFTEAATGGAVGGAVGGGTGYGIGKVIERLSKRKRGGLGALLGVGSALAGITIGVIKGSEIGLGRTKEKYKK